MGNYNIITLRARWGNGHSLFTGYIITAYRRSGLARVHGEQPHSDSDNVTIKPSRLRARGAAMGSYIVTTLRVVSPARTGINQADIGLPTSLTLISFVSTKSVPVGATSILGTLFPFFGRLARAHGEQRKKVETPP